MTDHYDLVVIGAGPAGEKGAAQAAYFGKRVCVVERAPRPGGAAVNSGTIPSKTLRETALHFSQLRQRGLYGVDVHVQPNITIADFMYRERAVVDAEWQLIGENLARHHVTVVQGVATIVDPHAVEVTRYGEEPHRLSAEVILVATGSHPLRPPDFPFDDELGGGVVGCEYAAIFAALGVRVTLVNERSRLLSQLDHEASEALRSDLTRRLAVQVLLDAQATEVRVEGDDKKVGVVRLRDGTELVADCVLVSLGREGATRGLGLAEAGVRINERGFILVDEHYRTTVPSIIAAGDVVGFPALASTSMEQARVAVCHAFDLKYKQRLANVIPYGVWTIPEIACVGESEDSARQKGLNFEIGKASYRLNARGQIIGDLDGFVKLVFHREDQRLLGCTIVGETACELIHVAAAVLAFEGTIDYFIQSVFNYPTLGDAYKYAAYDGLQRLARRVTNTAGLPRVE